MNDQQPPHPQITEEVCKEITRETTSLLGDTGTIISGLLSSSLNYVMAVLTAIIFASAMYSEVLKYTNINEQHRVPIYLASVMFFSMAAIFITQRRMKEIGLRHAEITRDASVMILCCRERLLQACREILCKSDQKQYCIDISITLNSIMKMKRLLKEDCSKLCETMEKTSSSNTSIDLKTNLEYG